eukprot:3795906-Pyramimonas_sp.AAC.1
MGKGSFSFCQGCGNWAHIFRIKRNNGVCAKCQAQVELNEPRRAAANPPWRIGGQRRMASPQHEVCPLSLLDQLARLPMFATEARSPLAAKERYEAAKAVPQQCLH